MALLTSLPYTVQAHLPTWAGATYSGLDPPHQSLIKTVSPRRDHSRREGSNPSAEIPSSQVTPAGVKWMINNEAEQTPVRG